MADGLDELGHEVASAGAVRVPVGRDHVLVDAPGRFDLDVLVGREQRLESSLLLVGEQVRTGLQGPPCTVAGVAGMAAVPAGVLLDAASALVQGVTGQAHYMERVHDRDGVGQFLGGGGLEPGEPVHLGRPRCVGARVRAVR